MKSRSSLKPIGARSARSNLFPVKTKSSRMTNKQVSLVLKSFAQQNKIRKIAVPSVAKRTKINRNTKKFLKASSRP